MSKFMKHIWIDYILNIILFGSGLVWGGTIAKSEQGAIMVLMIICFFLGIFVVADSIYWISRVRERKVSVVVYEIVKFSVFIKCFAIFFIGVVAIIFAVYTYV